MRGAVHVAESPRAIPLPRLGGLPHQTNFRAGGVPANTNVFDDAVGHDWRECRMRNVGFSPKRAFIDIARDIAPIIDSTFYIASAKTIQEERHTGDKGRFHVLQNYGPSQT